MNKTKHLENRIIWSPRKGQKGTIMNELFEKAMICLAYEASEVSHAEKVYDIGNYWCQYTSYGTIRYDKRVIVVEVWTNQQGKAEALTELHRSGGEISVLANFPEKAEFVFGDHAGHLPEGTNTLTFYLWNPPYQKYVDAYEKYAEEKLLKVWCKEYLLPFLKSIDGKITAVDYREVQGNGSILLTRGRGAGEYLREIPVRRKTPKGLTKEVMKNL